MPATQPLSSNRSNLISRWAFPLVLGLLFLTWFLFPRNYGVFPLDDTYIHFSYVRNLVKTGVFCFNPDEPSIGTSSPLWVILLTFLHRAGIDLYWAAQISCLLLFGLLCFLTMDAVRISAVRLGFSQDEAGICSFFAGLLLVLNGNLHWFAWSGMETMLFLCLCFLAIKRYRRHGFDYVTGMIAGLVFLTRIPGVLLCAVLILFELFKKHSTVHKGLIAMILVVSPYLLLSFKITGSWLPTTVRGKLATYVDEGMDWGGIPQNEIQDKFLLRKLLEEKIITLVANKPYHIFFSDDISDEDELRTRLRRVGFVNEEQFTHWWRMSHKNRIFWFLCSFLIYQKYLPHNYILLLIIIMTSIFIAHKYRGRWRELMGIALNEQVECAILFTWGLSHLMLYTLKFRILLHHCRYFANEFVIWTILGSLGLFLLFRHRPRIEKRFLGIASLIMAASTLFFWREVYAGNLRHIEEVYIKMGKWIHENTPPAARIASFDIGVLRYIGNRYTVDMGGLVDPGIHPYLKIKECGEYISKKKADYILYSRNLDVDFFTGIYLAEYQGSTLLKQIPLIQFEIPQFEAPTLIHSFRLELNKVIGWYPKTEEGILQAFSYDNRPYQYIGKMIDDRFEFVGYSIDQRSIEYIPFYPYTINFTFFYRTLAPLDHVYWFHTAFFDPQTNNFYYHASHIPTNDLLKYNKWPLNTIIQSHHAYFVPRMFKQQKYRIRVAVTRDQFLDNPEKLLWVDLGPFENKGNVLKPVDYQQLLALSTN